MIFFLDRWWKLYWKRYIMFTIMNTLNLEWVLWYKLTMCYIYQHIAHCHCYLNEMQIVLISHPQNVKHFLYGIKRVAMHLNKHFLSLLWLSGVKLCISGLLFHGWYEIWPLALKLIWDARKNWYVTLGFLLLLVVVGGTVLQ